MQLWFRFLYNLSSSRSQFFKDVSLFSLHLNQWRIILWYIANSFFFFYLMNILLIFHIIGDFSSARSSWWVFSVSPGSSIPVVLFSSSSSIFCFFILRDVWQERLAIREFLHHFHFLRKIALVVKIAWLTLVFKLRFFRGKLLLLISYSPTFFPLLTSLFWT